MKCLNWNVVNEVASKALDKWCVYVSNGLDFNETFDTNEQTISDAAIFEIVKKGLAKIYTEHQLQTILGDLTMGGLFVFDTEAEAWDFYRIFELEHVDSSSIYVNIISPTNGTVTENT